MIIYFSGWRSPDMTFPFNVMLVFDYYKVHGAQLRKLKKVIRGRRRARKKC